MYKACLVAKGFTQTYRINYQETFASVAKLNTIRVLLSLVANLEWPLQQLDEEVYMDLPSGFEDNGRNNLVCKLRLSLYDLKQSPTAWFERFTKIVKGYGFMSAP